MEPNQNITTENAVEKKKGSARKVLILLGIGLGTALVGGLGYLYFSQHNGSQIPPETSNDVPESPQPGSSKPKPVSKSGAPPKIKTPTTGGFPLKAGSKGAQVKQLQQALIKTYGSKLLAAHGADGIFGKELTSALKSKGLPLIIDKPTFDKITGKISSTSSNQAPAYISTPELKEQVEIASNLWWYCNHKNIDEVLKYLGRIKNVQQYAKVNTFFKTLKVNGVKQTIVSGVFSSFPDSISKQLIKAAFKKIGLKYNDNSGVWSLSGFDQSIII